ncbi:MAG: TonB-dependent receptor [Bacteroidales bacterium]|nr:TonB-dependent receptor [Bacteroidales bacterium]
MRNILVLIFVFLFSNSFAQFKVKGVLKDSAENKTLAYANIALIKQLDSLFISGTTTDENGLFALNVADTGNYFLRISFLGYGTQFLPLLVQGEKREIDLGTVLINKSAQMLDAVVITAQKPMYAYDGEKKVYNVSEDPSVQGGVATDALQNAPGVYVDMEGNITLRGVSSVAIWLNDKPSRITAEGLKSFLQQLPANSIERIEVITNPSAKYSAEGSGGIINIVTNQKIKRNILFSFGVSGNTIGQLFPWASFVVGNEKLSFSTYFGHGQYNWKGFIRSEGVFLNSEDTIYSFKDTTDTYYRNNWNYAHFNVSWEINKNNTLDVWGGGSLGGGKNNSSATNIKLMENGNLIKYSQEYDGSSDNIHPNGGLSFEHRFKKEGHKISLDNYFWGSKGSNTYNSFKLYSDSLQSNYKTLQNNKDNYGSVSNEINYTNPLGKRRELEIGTQYSYDINEDNSQVDTFNFVSSEFLKVPLFSNELNQRTNSGAIYTTYRDTFKIISYKIGLRYEFLDINLKSVALDKPHNRFMGTFFPTLHLSTKSKNNDNYTLSYSRRVRNPRWELDPFCSRSSKESASYGNPWLNPAFTDAYEASYAHFFKKGSSISATVYHRRTLRDITRKSEGVYDTLFNKYILYSTYINAGKNISTGGDFNIVWRPTPAYRIMFNVNLYNQCFKADLGSYKIDKSSFTYDSKIIFMWNYKILRLNIMAFYRGATENLQGNSKPNYFINVNASADLFKRKLSLRLGMQDVFNWQKSDRETITPSYVSKTYSKNRTQFLTFGVTVRLGKIELEHKMAGQQGMDGMGGGMGM